MNVRSSGYLWCVGWCLAFGAPLGAEDPPKGDEAVFRDLRMQYTVANDYMDAERYEEASQIYRALINRGQDLGFDRRTYLELSTGLAEALIGMRDAEGAELVLQDLLDLDPPADLYLRTSLMRARLLADEGRVSDAYLTLTQVEERIPKEEWAEEDTNFLGWTSRTLNKKWETTLMTAERLFDSGLYDEAVPFYTEVVQAINSGAYPDAQAHVQGAVNILVKVRHRLAQSYYMTERFDGVVTVLSNLSGRFYSETSELKHLYLSDLHLLGSSARQLKDTKLAVEAFTAYLEYSDLSQRPLENEVLHELGMAYLDGGQLEEAREKFDQLSLKADSADLYYRAQLFLGRLDLVESNYRAVEKRLSKLVGTLDLGNPLRMEVAYLRGEAAFEQGQYANAAAHFESAVPKRNKHLADWSEKALFNLGWAYMRLGEDPTADPVAQEEAFDKAERTFASLLEGKPDEEVYLSMAQGYLARGRRLNDEASFSKVEELLGKKASFKDLAKGAQALAIRAEAAHDYEQREALYQELTQDIYRETDLFAQAWYWRGLNHFEKAEALQQEHHFTEANAAYDQAIDAYYQAFHLLKDHERALAGRAISYQARAYLAQGGFEGYFMGFSLYEKLLSQNRDIFTAMREQDEVLYFRGLAASHMMEFGEGERFAQIAEESLTEVVKRWEVGDFVADALNVLGTIYFKQNRFEEAESTFVTLANNYPYSQHVGEAWFWAGESAEWQHKDQNLVRRYRRKVFEEYAHAPHAAEAYFNYYSYSDYLQGQGQAMEHLGEMQERFPNSPFLIVANYLVGLDYKGHPSVVDEAGRQLTDQNSSIQAFEDAKLHFDFCYEHGLVDNRNLEYLVNVRYRAMAERAKAYFQVAEVAADTKQAIYLEYAEQAYREIVADFENGDQPLTAFLHSDETYGNVRDEADYGLAQVYRMEGEDSQAQEVLAGLIHRYSDQGESRGYYLSRAYQELGQMATQSEDFDLALNLFTRAEEAGRSQAMTTDQKLDLWLSQADCYRCREDLDRSMTYLSKVINEDVTSAKRVKAMYQRAEIYELQGRHEMALKQLESTANKGGDWAYKAKEKLENDYGFN